MTGSGELPVGRTLALVGGLVILLQAVILTAVAVPAPHTGGDNAAYLLLAQALAEGAGYVELWDPDMPSHTKYPPGYPLLLALLIVVGTTAWTAFKLSSAVAVSAATLAAFAWAADRRGPLVGGALALLLVLSAGWQEASRWILSEPWFLLWTFVALWAGDRALRPDPTHGADEAPGTARARVRGIWLVTAGAAALMAFGIRVAGLPVILSFLLALVLARRLRAAWIFGGVSAVAVGGWIARALVAAGEGAYQSEFFLRNPYDPELGTVGIPGLLGRVWSNGALYVGEVLPREWWGTTGEWTAVGLGTFLFALALAGWIAALRRRPGPAELFVPFYGGMILLWPEVWSGDRFLLPLLPVILLYAGEALAHLATVVAARRGWRGSVPAGAILAGGVLALSLPAIPPTLDRAEEAAGCRALVEATQDAFSCWGEGVLEFRAAAAWAGRNLPDDAVVLTRKPRIFHALGGPRSRTYPFTDAPDRFLDDADADGARYLLVDRWDAMAQRYASPVVAARPGAFCYVVGWGSREPGSAGTDLLGILPPDMRDGEEEGGALSLCPPDWTVPDPRMPEVDGTHVPRLRAARASLPHSSASSPWSTASATP